MLVVGLLLLAGAVVVGVAGISANTGTEHQLPGGFAIFGYHLHDSVGKMFLGGILLGAVGMLGFMMMAEGLRRNAALRRELFRFRQDARARRRNAPTAPVTAPATPASATAPAPVTTAPAATAPATTAAPAPSMVDRVLARTGPRSSSGGTSSGDGVTGTGTTGVGATTSADSSTERRSLRNWRTSKPDTSQSAASPTDANL